MEVKCRLNGELVVLSGEKTDRLRDALYRAGCYSVRDSDDAEGFAGSDTIIFNGKLKYANFILLYQAKNAEIRTAESLLNGTELNYVPTSRCPHSLHRSRWTRRAAHCPGCRSSKRATTGGGWWHEVSTSGTTRATCGDSRWTNYTSLGLLTVKPGYP